MAIEIRKPGLLSTVQDHGRTGHYHLGIPPSGAMDQVAFRSANLLLGNPETAAVLECALMGPDLVATADTHVAITGAELPITLDGEPRPTSTVIAMRAGQLLSCGMATAGARAYIAVAGGFDVAERLGSRSTYVLGGLGGHQGRALAAGDVLEVGTPGAVVPGRMLDEGMRSALAKSYELRVIPGLYDHLVKPGSLAGFFGETWKVASESDRIGYRFNGGSPLDYVERTPPFGAGSDPSNIVDAPYPIGSVQVPGGTQPIVLHRDAVSAGGYMMIGCVISADMDLLGQMTPHTAVRFVQVTMEDALRARKERAGRLQRIRDALA
jgi:biotin-dependent carboxylase-like uncharacterized protein